MVPTEDLAAKTLKSAEMEKLTLLLKGQMEESFAEIWTPFYNKIRVNYKDMCSLVT